MKILDNDTLRKIHSLSLKINIPVSGNASGNRKSRSKGSSVEFSDFREYVPGDDFRRVDWNAYGRFDKLYVKLFMEEREAPVRIFLDTSKSMNFGEPSKNAAARRLAAALSYLSLLSYDRVTIIPWNSKAESAFGPYRTQGAFIEIVNLLEELPDHGESKFSEALKNMEWKSGRGISIVITDGLIDSGMEEGLKYLKYRRQEIYFCHILSPQEISPQIDGALELVDCETGKTMEVTVSGALLDLYQKSVNKFLAGIKEQCRKWGVRHSLLTSDLPVDRMVRQLIS
ncbi:MAG: DUF58 domain-containing protein [Clostridiaceae bacterium]|jgi:uncharacterized protein (DUF58 family)|nr:DUF58 domain-containing protein [Clostridiaceae bacterium]